MGQEYRHAIHAKYWENTMSEKPLSLAEKAYEKIKQNIMNLTYPPGMPLTEAMLTKELGMSRSPVRSAVPALIGRIAFRQGMRCLSVLPPHPGNQ